MVSAFKSNKSGQSFLHLELVCLAATKQSPRSLISGRLRLAALLVLFPKGGRQQGVGIPARKWRLGGTAGRHFNRLREVPL